jgi:hypothetical protein
MIAFPAPDSDIFVHSVIQITQEPVPDASATSK